LARAQTWLREGSNEALTEYARVAARQGRIKQRHLAEIERALSAEGLKRQRNRALVQWMKGETPTTSNRKQRGNETSPDAVSALARPYSHPYYWAGFIYTGS
jgi:CHAT domain-containing protein